MVWNKVTYSIAGIIIFLIVVWVAYILFVDPGQFATH